MTDRLAALLAASPELERAARLARPRLPVLPALEEVLPGRGLALGTTTSVRGPGATSLALGLVALASRTSWVAAVGLPALGLKAAADLGVDLDHLVVVAEPRRRGADVLSALVSAFDVVLTSPVGTREARKLSGRIRERDVVVVCLGRWPEGDLEIEVRSARWEGAGQGHGRLAARTVEVAVTGRHAAARPRHAEIWLPSLDGGIEAAARSAAVVRLAT